MKKYKKFEKNLLNQKKKFKKRKNWKKFEAY